MIIREHARRGEGNDPHRCDCEQKRTERVACRMRVPIERTKDQNRPDEQKKRTYPDQSEPHIRSEPRAAGTMHVVHDDGTEQEIRPGQAYVIDPGTTPGLSATKPSSASSSIRGLRRSTRKAEQPAASAELEGFALSRAGAVRDHVTEEREDDEDPLPAGYAATSGVPEDHVQKGRER